MFKFKNFINSLKGRLTFNTSCNDDMLPKGLGDRGSDGGCSRGLDGATRLAPVFNFFF